MMFQRIALINTRSLEHVDFMVQLSQRDRATLRVIEYFAKSLKSVKIIQNDTVQVPISIPLKQCLYLVPFVRHLA